MRYANPIHFFISATIMSCHQWLLKREGHHYSIILVGKTAQADVLIYSRCLGARPVLVLVLVVEFRLIVELADTLNDSDAPHCNNLSPKWGKLMARN